MTEAHRFLKPEWDLNFDETSGAFSLKPYVNEMSRKVWEINETLLTTAVVDLLRSKGWTVEPPDGVGDD